jgi:hypothetical protein
LDNRYVRPGRQSAHEIGAPDDPDDAAVTDDDRYALYAMCRQEPRNLMRLVSSAIEITGADIR